MEVVTPHLPDARVRLTPVLNNVVADIAQKGPHPDIDLPHVVGELEGSVHQFAVDVELFLPVCLVPDPHRPRPPVPFKVGKLHLLDIGFPPQAVHNLHPPCPVLGEEVLYPPEVILGLPEVTEVIEGLEREGGVPYPGEAVVPVSHPPDLLGERGGGSRGYGAGGVEGEEFQDEGGTVDHLFPPTGVDDEPRFTPL